MAEMAVRLSGERSRGGDPGGAGREGVLSRSGPALVGPRCKRLCMKRDTPLDHDAVTVR